MRSYRGGNDTFRVTAGHSRAGPGEVADRVGHRLVGDLEGDLGRPAAVDPVDARCDLDGPCNGDDGKPMGREPELARILSAWQRAGVRNVVFITADVHYTAAHHYSPERAAYTDFDPFWEFVSGPLVAETFPRKDGLLDRNFGPEVVFSKGNDCLGASRRGAATSSSATSRSTRPVR